MASVSPAKKRSPLRTQIYPGAVENSQALYEHLRDTIEWEEGIRSKKGFTRLAKSIDLTEYPELTQIIAQTLKEKCEEYLIYGVYLNYYRDGEMWTPNHSHKGTHQLVISLGATRTLTVGNRAILMKSGDAVLFGGSIHGVPKEPDVREGRISIATFMQPL